MAGGEHKLADVPFYRLTARKKWPKKEAGV
jgi:hypothetical protein